MDSNQWTRARCLSIYALFWLFFVSSPSPSLGFLLFLEGAGSCDALRQRYSPSLFSSNRGMSSSEKPSSIYDITVKDAKGNDVSLSEYKDKVLLIVNVASQCGFTTSNYKELNELYEKYKDKGLEILAFPCNQFAGQEPGSNEEIQQTVCTRFKAEFPVFGKVNVNGAETAPVYKYLKSVKGGGIFGDFIKWNFSKFLVSKTGEVVERYAPTTNPSKIEKDILKLL